VVKYVISLGHQIKLQDTSILSTKPRCIDRMIKAAIQIKLHSSNMNRDDGLCLKPVMEASCPLLARM
jgi:hypothetical protein